MHLPTLMAECDAPQAVRNIVDDLIAQKAVLRELGTGELPVAIASFIDGEFRYAPDMFDAPVCLSMAEGKAEAQAFFMKTLSRFAGLCSS